MSITQHISGGTIHELTHTLKLLLQTNETLHEYREKLTPLARNEWICYITMPKKEETKERRLTRLQEEILAGKKRPCCRPGCPHHRESAKKRFKS